MCFVTSSGQSGSSLKGGPACWPGYSCPLAAHRAWGRVGAWPAAPSPPQPAPAGAASPFCWAVRPCQPCAQHTGATGWSPGLPAPGAGLHGNPTFAVLVPNDLLACVVICRAWQAELGAFVGEQRGAWQWGGGSGLGW